MLELRDYQQRMLKKIDRYLEKHQGNPCGVLPTGCHAKGQGILMADGTVKAVEDIVIGDRVMGPDGTPRNVIDIHRGSDFMYRILPDKDGDFRPFTVNPGHILSVIDDNGTIDEIPVCVYFTKSDGYKRTHYLYKGKAPEEPCTEKAAQPLPFHAEFIGFGDYYGFECDGDRLYMLDDSIVCHNSGKSIVIAALLQNWLQKDSDSKLLMVTHQKELVNQDNLKLFDLWPDAPVGIYSASIGRKDLSKPITMANIQSIARVKDVPPYSLIVVDEAHMINNNETGSYRKLIARVKEKNPACRVVGFTATPYRLGQGLITEKPSIFTDILETTTILQLQKRGYLAWLRTKKTAEEYNTEGITIRNGEFVDKELIERVTTYEGNDDVCDEIVKSAAHFGRKHILVFCSGIAHAELICDKLNERGVPAKYVTGEMGNKERDAVFDDFTSGRIQALCNVNLASIGFDYPDIDMIVMLRPTMSPGLFVQQLGRGLRIKSKPDEYCLVLDFAGNTKRHGPITEVRPPQKKGRKSKRRRLQDEVPLVQVCPECNEVFSYSLRKCPACGCDVSKTVKEIAYQLSDLDINGIDNRHFMFISSWKWYVPPKKPNMLMCFFNPYFSDDKPVHVLFPINSKSKELAKNARTELHSISIKAPPFTADRSPYHDWLDTEGMADFLNTKKAPFGIIWHADVGYDSELYNHIDAVIYPERSDGFKDLLLKRNIDEVELKRPLFRPAWKRRYPATRSHSYGKSDSYGRPHRQRKAKENADGRTDNDNAEFQYGTGYLFPGMG